MLQRIQSVFMILSTVAIALTILLPLGHFDNNGIQFTMTAMGLKSSEGVTLPSVNHYMFIAPLIVAGLVTLKGIFNYKNRAGQLRDIRLSFLMLAIGMVLMAMYVNSAQTAQAESKFHFGMAFFLPIVALVFNWLAAKHIRKDEALVRSVDRIR